MKTYTGKTNGKAFKGIYTNSCMPNQKPKRMRKSAYQKFGEDVTEEIVKVDINGIGIGAAVMTFFCIPLNLPWQICIAGLFILSAIHVEVKENDK